MFPALAPISPGRPPRPYTAPAGRFARHLRSEPTTNTAGRAGRGGLYNTGLGWRYRQQTFLPSNCTSPHDVSINIRPPAPTYLNAITELRPCLVDLLNRPALPLPFIVHAKLVCFCAPPDIARVSYLYHSK